MWICVYCLTYGDENSGVVSHFQQYHRHIDGGIIVCACNAYLNNDREFSVHVEAAHVVNIFGCTICAARFKDEARVLSHIVEQHCSLN